MKLLRRILCAIGRHRYVLVSPLSGQSDLIACYDCKKRFAINYSVRCVLPFDREMEKFYEELYTLGEPKP
jgi:hypothetical protein